MTIVEVIYRYEGGSVPARPQPVDAQGARDRLDEGSRTFGALLEGGPDAAAPTRHVVPVDLRDLGLDSGVESAPAQRPYAAVLGCSDARVPIELIFNEGPNDLFVVRVAGNGLGSEVLGSLRYAVDRLGGSLKLVVVLGHSGCGAVSAAVDVFLNPEAYLSLADAHALRGLLDRLLVVVNASAMKLAATFGPEVTRRPGYRAALIEAAVATNAALAAYTVQREIGTADPSGLRAAYGVYLLSGREIWAPRGGSAATTGLAWPPSDRSSFAEFADALVRSDRLASLLDREAD
jgi:carbonic anhydrase